MMKDNVQPNIAVIFITIHFIFSSYSLSVDIISIRKQLKILSSKSIKMD